MNLVQPRLSKGLRDLLPEDTLARQAMIDVVRRVYELYGFIPLTTPAVEYLDVLSGSGGQEIQESIFLVQNPEEEQLGLRFDHTVPLARVIAQYKELPKPFRRYTIGPVWRADKPGPGRFREFLQFDIDSVGVQSEMADTEIIGGIQYASRSEVVKKLHETFGSIPGATEEIAVLERMSHYLDVAGYHDDRVVIDLSIARGLAYYSGPVFETILLDAPQFGSVFSGGRYDDLVMRFLGERVPATGASMGVDRLLAALRALDKVKLRKSTADVLVTTFDPQMNDDYIAMTYELRRAGIRTEMYFGTDRAGKQIKFADKLEIPVVLLYGPDERAKNVVTIKDMSVGRARAQQLTGSRDQWLEARPGQFEVPRQNLAANVKELSSKIAI